MPADRPVTSAPDTTVVDASVFAALAFGESRSQQAADLLQEAALIAPGLVRYETTNITRAKIRSDPGAATNVTLALLRWLGLSVYDAAYVQIARKLDAPLLTFDERRAHTAGR